MTAFGGAERKVDGVALQLVGRALPDREPVQLFDVRVDARRTFFLDATRLAFLAAIVFRAGLAFFFDPELGFNLARVAPVFDP